MGQDFSRSPPGRYLGYAHVVGQSLPGELLSPVARQWMSRVTTGYAAYDVIVHATDSRGSNALLKAGDALIWQGLATYLAPPLLVHWTRRGAILVMNHLKMSNTRVPLVVISLFSLAVLGPVVDDAVDTVMNNTTRKVMLNY